ncbi:NADH-cytochrome b5 reductase [Spiromyces aspiralis]|uniref:NADH-cytochrome b5 reductase n=1 Tax=Spiromyces aspiralis TaxID=68401 RepID=A0ACC1HRC2_9FUNG|nr:NADH-cytochrome b5 reductase [Spiromyces aspiralis]
MVEIDGKEVSRSYTPISLDDDKGYFELLIKSYPNGVLSKHFDSLKIGDSIKVRGPKGNFKYVPNTIRHIGMIAGGSGLTPMYQIILSILRNSNDKTKLDLIYANVNEEDILLRSELDRLAKLHSNFNVYYVLNNPPEDWEGGDGFVSEDMIAEHMPMPAPDIKVLICGPPPMVKAMESHLVNLGYDKPRVVSKAEDQVFKF